MTYSYTPEIIFADSADETRLFRTIAEQAQELEQPVYIVGGYVRDAILGRDNKDIDLVTIGSGIELARRISKRLRATKPKVFRNFGTASFKFKSLNIEFVGARCESYRRDSRKPIVENGTLEQDLTRRDFTVNALAVSLNRENFGELIDLFGGLEDMNRALLRTPRNPRQTFDDDPLRMMRAARFASQLGFTIEDAAFEAMKEFAERLKIVSIERTIDEFNKILLSPMPSLGLHILAVGGLLERFLPELTALKGVETVEGQGHKDNFYHTLQVVDNVARVSDDLWLRWAALLHDVGKTQTKRFIAGQGWTFHAHEFVGAKMVPKLFRRLRMPLNDKMRFVEKLVALHMRPIALVDEQVTDSAIRRLLFDAGNDIDSLMKLCEADITSKNERTVARHMRNFKMVRRKIDDLEARDAVRNFQPPISGEEIMQTFNIKPCRQVGVLKNSIKEAILDGKIPNNPEKAREYMLEVANEMGLKPSPGV